MEHSALEMELQSLRKHKEWADQKIDQLIRRVREAEGPQRLLKEEVQQLRLVSSDPPHSPACCKLNLFSSPSRHTIRQWP